MEAKQGEVTMGRGDLGEEVTTGREVTTVGEVDHGEEVIVRAEGCQGSSRPAG